MKKIITLILAIALLASLTGIYALDTTRQQLLDFGHVLYVNGVTSNPSEVTPGDNAVISINLENIATQDIKDLVIGLGLPIQIATYNDVDTKKIARMSSGETQTVSFSIIVLPTTDEGVYKIPLSLSYINNVGEERVDNQTISIVVKSQPNLYAELKSSEVYYGNNLGTVSIRIVNNNVGNIKFLTASLGDSKAYEIISSNTEYVGDLNSDDFSDVNFKIKVRSSDKEINLPLNLKYKDALNKDYNEDVNVTLKMYTATEL